MIREVSPADGLKASGAEWVPHARYMLKRRRTGVETATVTATMDHRGKTITTFVVYDATIRLRDLSQGEVLELVTDDFEPFRHDIAAWCEAVGHRLLAAESIPGGYQFLIEKGAPHPTDTKLAFAISEGGLLELLSPLGFALAAALEGIEVTLYMQGPAVKVLAAGYRPRIRGWGRPFTRFAAAGLNKTGHVAPQEKLRQIKELGGEIYVCGPSMQHFKVKPEELIFGDLPIVEYLTFMNVMKDADIQLFV
jgi:predicted peroxiredoxin/TusA-related sulfurtransferase